MKGYALYIIGVSLLSPCAATAHPGDSLTVLERAAGHESCFRQIAGSTYANPAMKQFMQGFSYTRVTVGYAKEHQSKAVCTQAGHGGDEMSFDADTYIKYKNATLWGEGFYGNGHRRDPVWNEVSDAALVYPYFTADAIGGDMKDETYRFAGGYSAYDGRVAWGASLGYAAGHHYRDVDPRPRNVTGRLDIKAGAGYRLFGKYVVAIGGEFMKYKQTSDIDFMSELGQTTVYHLTGLATDYVRFRGNGFTTHYDGQRFGVQADVAPQDGNGLTGTLHVARLTMETVLDDMNKLPLADVWHNSLFAELGYKRKGKTTWGASADFGIYRRHGKENVFGDAASSTYPQIGTVEMYADNAYNTTVRGLAERVFGSTRLSYMPSFGYSHRCQIYADPAREWLVNSWSTSHSLKASRRLGDRWHGAVLIAWNLCKPVSSHLIATDDGSGAAGLMDTMLSDFRYASATRRSYSAGLDLRYAVDRNNALLLSVEYRRDSYGLSTFGNLIRVNAGVCF